MITRTTSPLLIVLTMGATLATGLSWPAAAQDMQHHHHHGIDWQQLSLSADQNQRIEQLQGDWRVKYSQEMPLISRQRQHLHDLFSNPQADPLEIVASQQSLIRLQEQLRNEATANYLHKRAVLNDSQQRLLEAQMHQMVIERQQRPLAHSNAQPEENSGIMNMVSKVRWAIEPHSSN